MPKVLSAQELSDLLASQSHQVDLASLVSPTADDLLRLTEAALSDVDASLSFTPEEMAALRAALRQRLTGALSDIAHEADETS